MPTTLKTEWVNDVPLILAQLERMGVQELLDKFFPTHENWQGLSLGNVVVVCLTHILSQADHCLLIVINQKSQESLWNTTCWLLLNPN